MLLKHLTPVALAVSALCLAGAAQAAPNQVYSETVAAHNAPMTVDVIVKDGKIQNILVDDRESPGAGKRAIAMLKKQILDHQTVNVDAVTGASITSSLFVTAVKEDLKRAGLDLSKFQKPIPHKILNDSYETQVVIVGGGGAGLAAAAAAVEAGGKVIIVEKLGFLGGSTAISGGGYNAVDPERQNRQGIEDSIDRHFNDTMSGGHQKNNPELARYLVEKAPEVMHWLEVKGVHFRPTVNTIVGGLYPRGHSAAGGGFAYTDWLETFIRAYPGQVQIFTDTTAKKLIQDSSGRVVGVEAEHDGKKVAFKATKGVIVTTGGFAANVKLRQEVNTGPWKDMVLDSSIGSTNSLHASQGDGLKLAKDVGAELIDLDYIQLHPGGTPGTGIMSSWPSGRNRLFVNVEGERFVNEDAPRDELCKAIFAEPESKYWVIMNKLRIPNEDVRIGILPIKEQLALGKAVKGETLEDLAKATGMDVAKLKTSIAGYNDVVTGKVKEDKFGFKKSMAVDAPFVEGPYYATPLVPAVHHTMGGIKINVKTQVLDAQGKVIPGLFAAGEVTGGVHGDNRVGGNGIADAMVFGKRAGEEALK